MSFFKNIKKHEKLVNGGCDFVSGEKREEEMNGKKGAARLARESG